MRRPQIDGQRLPRLWVQAFKSDVPDTAELRRAYQKFSTRRARPSAPRLGRWLIPGIVLAAGTAYAATGAPSRFLNGLLIQSRGVQRALAPTVPNQPLRLGAAPGASSPSPSVAQRQTDPPSDTPKPAPLAGVLQEFRRPHAGVGPKSAQPQAESAPAAIGSARGERPPMPTDADNAWQRAAQSLRDKDLAAADTALAEIEARGRTTERDAARLARAELLLASGKQALAVPHLRELAVYAKSSVVRDRARELLQRAKQNR